MTQTPSNMTNRERLLQLHRESTYSRDRKVLSTIECLLSNSTAENLRVDALTQITLYFTRTGWLTQMKQRIESTSITELLDAVCDDDHGITAPDKRSRDNPISPVSKAMESLCQSIGATQAEFNAYEEDRQSLLDAAEKVKQHLGINGTIYYETTSDGSTLALFEPFLSEQLIVIGKGATPLAALEHTLSLNRGSLELLHASVQRAQQRDAHEMEL